MKKCPVRGQNRRQHEGLEISKGRWKESDVGTRQNSIGGRSDTDGAAPGPLGVRTNVQMLAQMRKY